MLSLDQYPGPSNDANRGIFAADIVRDHSTFGTSLTLVLDRPHAIAGLEQLLPAQYM